MARSGFRARILLIEDDDDTRELLAEALADQFDVQAAPDAKRGLAQAASGGPPDVFLTDESLPGMRGALLAREVKARWPNARVILYSGYADVPDAESADLVLHKPLDLASLCSAIQSLFAPP